MSAREEFKDKLNSFGDACINACLRVAESLEDIQEAKNEDELEKLINKNGVFKALTWHRFLQNYYKKNVGNLVKFDQDEFGESLEDELKKCGFSNTSSLELIMRTTDRKEDILGSTEKEFTDIVVKHLPHLHGRRILRWYRERVERNRPESFQNFPEIEQEAMTNVEVIRQTPKSNETVTPDSFLIQQAINLNKEPPRIFSAIEVWNLMAIGTRPSCVAEVQKHINYHVSDLKRYVTISSDPTKVVHGYGIVATEYIDDDKFIVDPTAILIDGRLDPRLENTDYYIYVSGDASFQVRAKNPSAAAYTYYLNEARGDKEPNIKWVKISKDSITGWTGSTVKLAWKTIKHIMPGEELLVRYNGHDDVCSPRITVPDLSNNHICLNQVPQLMIPNRIFQQSSTNECKSGDVEHLFSPDESNVSNIITDHGDYNDQVPTEELAPATDDEGQVQNRSSAPMHVSYTNDLIPKLHNDDSEHTQILRGKSSNFLQDSSPLQPPIKRKRSRKVLRDRSVQLSKKQIHQLAKFPLTHVHGISYSKDSLTENSSSRVSPTPHSSNLQFAAPATSSAMTTTGPVSASATRRRKNLFSSGTSGRGNQASKRSVDEMNPDNARRTMRDILNKSSRRSVQAIDQTSFIGCDDSASFEEDVPISKLINRRPSTPSSSGQERPQQVSETDVTFLQESDEVGPIQTEAVANLEEVQPQQVSETDVTFMQDSDEVGPIQTEAVANLEVQPREPVTMEDCHKEPVSAGGNEENNEKAKKFDESLGVVFACGKSKLSKPVNISRRLEVVETRFLEWLQNTYLLAGQKIVVARKRLEREIEDAPGDLLLQAAVAILDASVIYQREQQCETNRWFLSEEDIDEWATLLRSFLSPPKLNAVKERVNENCRITDPRVLCELICELKLRFERVQTTASKNFLKHCDVCIREIDSWSNTNERRYALLNEKAHNEAKLYFPDMTFPDRCMKDMTFEDKSSAIKQVPFKRDDRDRHDRSDRSTSRSHYDSRSRSCSPNYQRRSLEYSNTHSISRERRHHTHSSSRPYRGRYEHRSRSPSHRSYSRGSHRSRYSESQLRRVHSPSWDRSASRDFSSRSFHDKPYRSPSPGSFFDGRLTKYKQSRLQSQERTSPFFDDGRLQSRPQSQELTLLAHNQSDIHLSSQHQIPILQTDSSTWILPAMTEIDKEFDMSSLL